MIFLKKDYFVEKKYIRTKNGKIKLLIFYPENRSKKVPGVLWIHGGGYMTGLAEMAFFSRALDVVKSGAVVVAPSYTLSWKKSLRTIMELFGIQREITQLGKYI